MRTAGPPASVRRALRGLSYEILPFKDTEESVLAHVPRSVGLTIATTGARGLGPTLDLAGRLARHGYRVDPHLPARLVRDKQHLVDVVAQLGDAGIDGVLVIAGDMPEPAGSFPDSLSLLEVLDAAGHPFRRIGVAGYPEGHAAVDRELLDRAIEAKARYATHVITQICFDARVTARWTARLRERGVHLPVLAGLPGAVSRQKLVRVSAGLGLGQSARFLRRQRSLLWRFFLPGGYRPDRLLRRLAPVVDGFHLFTFNELRGTERWRQAMLSRTLSS